MLWSNYCMDRLIWHLWCMVIYSSSTIESILRRGGSVFPGGWTSNHLIRNVRQALWCVYFQCKFKIVLNCAIMNWYMNLQCYGPIIVRMDSYGICGACSYITIQLYGIDLIWHEIIMICGVMHVCLGYYELRYRKRWWVNILLSLPPCIADLYILFVGLP